MSTSRFSLLALFLLISLNSLDVTMGGRIIPPSAPSTVTRPLVISEAETSYMRPELDHNHKVFHGQVVRSCLPKGSKRNSAPSRFVNYKTLGSGGCSGMHSKKP
ncbi:putative transmembrane protein [Senna tora]|uniref:Putative transmembrane protein n=1 Tax=Senna tora TaxID=362788 RepID=A0A834SQU1_9FABA|nr:putative transmembrane protein [Senna tora]